MKMRKIFCSAVVMASVLGAGGAVAADDATMEAIFPPNCGTNLNGKTLSFNLDQHVNSKSVLQAGYFTTTNAGISIDCNLTGATITYSSTNGNKLLHKENDNISVPGFTGSINYDKIIELVASGTVSPVLTIRSGADRGFPMLDSDGLELRLFLEEINSDSLVAGEYTDTINVTVSLPKT